MKRSRAIVLAFVPVLSAMITVCNTESGEVVANCVIENDGEYLIVNEDYCSGQSGSDGFYYYGGYTNNNRSMSGGTTVRPKKSYITTPSGRVIQRGGFGGQGNSGG